MNTSEEYDSRIRSAAFTWLEKQALFYKNAWPWTVLRNGFEFEGIRIPLVSPQGIFRPKPLPEVPLTIRTSTSGQYNDSFDENGLFVYRYRGIDRNHPDNEGLRKAMHRRIPLIYLMGLVRGIYSAVWPVYIVGDDPKILAFKVEFRSQFIARADQSDAAKSMVAEPETEIYRAYSMVEVRKRLHQDMFRARVLFAYKDQCTCCRLRHVELLEAAHIIADSKPEGEPNVRNGLSLCILHHKAFDKNIFGIRPDYIMEVRKDILDEEDGPMLLHGLQGLHRKKIILPRPEKYYPDPRLLEQRWDEFASGQSFVR